MNGNDKELKKFYLETWIRGEKNRNKLLGIVCKKNGQEEQKPLPEKRQRTQR